MGHPAAMALAVERALSVNRLLPFEGLPLSYKTCEGPRIEEIRYLREARSNHWHTCGYIVMRSRKRMLGLGSFRRRGQLLKIMQPLIDCNPRDFKIFEESYLGTFFIRLKQGSDERGSGKTEG